METNRLTLNDVELRKRNFSGRITDYNERGNRECLVVLSAKHAHELGFESISEMVNELRADNWAIKRFNATDENPDPNAYIPARAVFFDREKSSIFLRTGKRSQLLNEDNLGIADGVEIEKVNCILNKHHYDSHGKEGYNVRIKSMEIYAVEDEICARNRQMDEDFDDVDELPFN